MKIHVSRGHHRSFKSASIEINSVEEWSTISIALLGQVEVFRKLVDEWTGDAENLEYAKTQYERFKKAYEALDVKNEVPFDENYVTSHMSKLSQL